METMGLAPILGAGLSTEVVETILSARDPSTRKLYVFKWRLFSLWCRECHLDPVNCPLA